MPSFSDRLAAAVKAKRTPVMVGLDPRAASLPAGLLRDVEAADAQAIAEAYVRFCRGVIEVVADQVAVVKPQMAFFEELGWSGLEALERVVKIAREAGLVVVLDGKRNDIGTTAEAYARAYLSSNAACQGDALTVSPYLGDDSLTPFVEAAKSADAGVFVLVKTSNPGGKTFQDLIVDATTGGQTLYRRVANLVQNLASESKGECGYGSVGAVVGATYPEQLAELRQAMPSAWLLVPGYGAQGGAAKDVAGAFDDSGLGAVVNSSRGIIFAHSLPRYKHLADWQEAVAQAARDMTDELRAETSTAKL